MLAHFTGAGYNGTLGSLKNSGSLRFYADAEWDTLPGDATDSPSRMEVYTTADASGTLVEHMEEGELSVQFRL